jgi:hypothetical protein
MNIAGGVCVASVLAVAVPIWVAPDFWDDHAVVNLILALAFVGSFFYTCWATAKGKGYAAWIGLVLPIFSILGIAILILLKDKHKGESFEVAKVLPPKPFANPIRPSSFVVGEDEHKSPIEDRIVQLEELRRKGLITDEEFKVRRENILDSL